LWFEKILQNEMFLLCQVLASLQKLKIKYELSYQSTTRLKYIDKGVGMIRAEIGLKIDKL
jgi:hypothetical protein